MKMIIVPFSPEWGEYDSIEQIIVAAFEEVRRLSIAERVACTLLGARKVVEFRHNGVRFHLAHDSGISALLAAWHDAMREMGDKDLVARTVIGPYVD